MSTKLISFRICDLYTMFNSFEVNKIHKDLYNRTSGVLAIDKPKDVTSHDVVDIVRKNLRTRKVGHAGALDPFATGVLLVMVGKYTKLSDELMALDKEYNCKLLLGVSTSTQDPEGKILQIREVNEINERDIEAVLQQFRDGYEQRVPVFSSVKVNGQKLRRIAHKAESCSIDENDVATFTFKNGSSKKIKLPRKKVRFQGLNLNSIEQILGKDIESVVDDIKPDIHFVLLDITVGSSKGTYIRQLAEDIGKALGYPAMLTELRRNRVGKFTLADTLDLDAIPEYNSL